MDNSYVVNSYRYIRLAMVVATITLGISLVLEIWAAGCYQGSISAFYYTPVHSIFIGVLFVVGVSLVALIGRDLVEDLFFNLAGFVALLVALVPTSRPTDLCGPTSRHLSLFDSAEESASATTRLLVTNNTWSLLLGFLIAFGLAFWLANRSSGAHVQRIREVKRSNWIGLLLSLVVLVAGLVWFLEGRDSFDRRAHGTAAVLMFVAIWLAVMVNADFAWSRPLFGKLYKLLGVNPTSFPGDSKRVTHYRARYRAIAAFMGIAGLIGGIAVYLGVSHAVFWLEVAEIVPFAIFWSYQTAEGWDTGKIDSAPVAT